MNNLWWVRHDIIATALGHESFIPQLRDRAEKRGIYTFTTANNYPPHLATIPNVDKAPSAALFDADKGLFNLQRLAATKGLLGETIADKLTDFVMNFATGSHADPGENQKTMAGLDRESKAFLDVKEGVQDVRNISERRDWYTDAVFAQQYYTGPNPMIIRTATPWHLDIFRAAATAQGLVSAQALLDSGATLLVADYSYFRKGAGFDDDDDIVCDDSSLKTAPTRYGCSSIVLFEQPDTKPLHPVAIVLDWRGNFSKSVTIFNQRLQLSDPAVDEFQDWPWRYAKTCAMAADWVDHELRTHLTATHLLEEAVIVAAQRSFDDNNPIYELLEPHWLKTLSLNNAAREVLVPTVIGNIGPFTLHETKNLVNYYYHNFDWTGNYVPQELAGRGFPREALDSGKFKNFAYARNMTALWPALREYVSSYLHAYANTHGQYETDSGVKDDISVRTWVQEMRGEKSAALQSFPVIQTRDQLVDALTLCIHIASPQHTAINYLQAYYMAFVVNKPPALFTPIPTTLDSLKRYTEQSLVDSLPIGKAKSQQWLVASHLPWLLSYKVSDNQTLLSYARTVAMEGLLASDAGKKLVARLDELKGVFESHSLDIKVDAADKNIPIEYNVMLPEVTAVSILI